MTTYDPVELAAFVSLRKTAWVFGFACAKLSEILGCFGNKIGEEFYFDAAERLSYMPCLRLHFAVVTMRCRSKAILKRF